MTISPLRLAALTLVWATLWSGAFVAMKVASDHADAYTIVGSAWTRLESGETAWTGVVTSIFAISCLVMGTVLTPKLVPPGNPWLSTGIQSLAAGLPALAVGPLFEDASPLALAMCIPVAIGVALATRRPRPAAVPRPLN